MVQQPFGANLAPNGTTLALPAIVASQQHQSVYPQEQNTQLYQQQQQQIIKSNQMQPQQFVQPRLNGIVSNGQSAATNFIQQQDSPNSSSNQIQQQDNLFNRAPIYAPKPTNYYNQQAAAVYGIGRSPIQQQQQPFYPNANLQQQQQQHSPASLQRTGSIQTNGLSVRQVPNGIVMNQQSLSMQPINLSPAQQSTQMLQQNSEQQQRQQQMQHLIMSYQQHQMNALQTADIMAQPTYPSQNDLSSSLQQQQQAHQSHVDIRWAQIQEEQRKFKQQQQSNMQLYNTQPQQQSSASNHLAGGAERLMGTVSGRPSRFSDRDSISTVSRFNQFDERRSFTMKSQYTSANHQQTVGLDRKFGFIRLTLEALKRISGLSSPDLIDGQNFHKNLLDRGLNSASNKNILNSTINQSNSITVIDSAEDYYFKKKVFKYQLTIMKVISLLSAAFVLLSPVAMLLIPKMEFLFNSNVHDYSEGSSATSSVGESNPISQPSPSITHAVGLTGKQALGQKQPPYFVPQPQWRISECTSDCDGLLIGFVIRLLMLCIAYWAIFFRASTATLPRIDFQRCLLTSIAVLVTLAYWLFFVFRLFDKRFNDFELQYMSIVQFALSMLESLILLHYLAVVLLEVRARKKIYCLKVVRSPDGESMYYSCGSLSIQKCAQFVLEKYHRQFKQFGPYSEQLLDFENLTAKNLSYNHRREEDQSGGERSRAPSPANSHSRNKTSRRSTSRTSRHQARTTDRSPSRSPVQDRSRRKSTDKSKSSSSGSKSYRIDLDASENQISQNTEKTNNSQNDNFDSAHESNARENSENKQRENDSTDQLSDSTGRMKESSLETIKAANSTADLINKQKPQADNANERNLTNSHRIGQDLSISQQHRSMRDDTESMRSARSRRSTSRSHKHKERERSERHHSSHRERSSSRANDNHEAHRSSISVSVPETDPLEDHEQKVRRRRLRLLAAVQEAFEQVKKINEGPNPSNNGDLSQQQARQQALGPNQAARSMYPGIARSLQKYLRLTKQTGRHNLQSIYEHLSKCLLYNLSPRVFLEKFVSLDPVWQLSETKLFANCTIQDSMFVCPKRQLDDLELNSWSLVCDTLLSRQIDSGTFFVLRQGQVSLLVTVARLPHLNLSEQVIEASACKFNLGSNIDSPN